MTADGAPLLFLGLLSSWEVTQDSFLEFLGGYGESDKLSVRIHELMRGPFSRFG
jgi:hypothetical protein